MVPGEMFIGVDANAAALVDVSRRALAKPARGGAANALFGVLALEKSPGELAGVADELTVLLPWGTLLRAAATADIAPLASLCKPSATLRFVFGYGAADGVGLPVLDVAALAERYHAAGIASARVRAVDVDEVRSLGTTWASKLAFSGHERVFVEVTAARSAQDGEVS